MICESGIFNSVKGGLDVCLRNISEESKNGGTGKWEASSVSYLQVASFEVHSDVELLS
jgi:hypothetical protein